YFEHVWAVHPIADIPEGRPLSYEGFRVSTLEFSENQTVIEGLSAYFRILRLSVPINFLVSQLRFVSYLITLVRRQRIAIVLSTDPYFSGLIGLSVKFFTGIPLVIWVCGNFDAAFQATGIPAMPRLFRWRWIEKVVERIVLREADLVAGGNQDNLEFALRNGATLTKSTVFPIGKLIHRQHLKEPKLRSVDGLLVDGENGTIKRYWFIYIGQLVEAKHPDDVLRAFSVIERSVPNSALIMAGDGTMRSSLETMAMNLGIRSKVNFLGYVSQQRLANILGGCFAVLSPLTGRSLLEGALAGLPIVAYDRDWQTEFVSNAGAGVIVPFRDWQAMGDAALNLVRHPVDARGMGEASRREALKRCDLDAIYNHERREFDKLLKRSRREPILGSEMVKST
ncbi:MAG: glycosyltransferase, partial [Gemmatimonadota bacterium]|nr:glycosyltransferase [Gemmatimonadota bacterium]